jgi:hypothetical protein
MISPNLIRCLDSFHTLPTQPTPAGLFITHDALLLCDRLGLIPAGRNHRRRLRGCCAWVDSVENGDGVCVAVSTEQMHRFAIVLERRT